MLTSSHESEHLLCDSSLMKMVSLRCTISSKYGAASSCNAASSCIINLFYCNVQVRVMPRCWYVLLRFFLRVDKVLVKLRETRLFCPFNTDSTVGPVIREIKYSEGTFEELSKAGAPPDGVGTITKGLQGAMFITLRNSHHEISSP